LTMEELSTNSNQDQQLECNGKAATTLPTSLSEIKPEANSSHGMTVSAGSAQESSCPSRFMPAQPRIALRAYAVAKAAQTASGPLPTTKEGLMLKEQGAPACNSPACTTGPMLPMKLQPLPLQHGSNSNPPILRALRRLPHITTSLSNSRDLLPTIQTQSQDNHSPLSLCQSCCCCNRHSALSGAGISLRLKALEDAVESQIVAAGAAETKHFAVLQSILSAVSKSSTGSAGTAQKLGLGEHWPPLCESQIATSSAHSNPLKNKIICPEARADTSISGRSCWRDSSAQAAEVMQHSDILP
jgi:hypothetical protein